jgi:hypothetical protein
VNTFPTYIPLCHLTIELAGALAVSVGRRSSWQSTIEAGEILPPDGGLDTFIFMVAGIP